jgi:acetolactate synthase-1/2/3 large subunit
MSTEIRYATAQASERSLTVAETIASTFADAGIERVFTFPGGGNLPLLEALAVFNVKVTLAHSEGGGAFMAATIADLTERPGVLVVGLGPGAASATNGAAHALLDRTPMLIIADRLSAAEAATSGHQLIDQAAMFAPVTKGQIVLQPQHAREMTKQAIDLCLEHPRGPVLIEVERDVAVMPGGSRVSSLVRQAKSRPSTEGAAIRDAAELVAQARRPVLLIGAEARYGLRTATLIAVAERLSAPVLATYKAKGVFPETHPLYSGILTGAPIESAVLAKADLLLMIGVDSVELLTRAWLYDAPLIALRVQKVSDRHLAPDRLLTGPIGETLDALLASLDEPRSEWEVPDVTALAELVLDSLRVQASGDLSTWRTVEVVQEEVVDALVAVDAGAHMFAATWFWRSSGPGRFLISSGLGSMGFAVPAAIAAAITRTDEHVIAFTGDGGFVLNSAELETAVRLGVKIIVIVLNDASLSLIRVKSDELGLSGVPLDYLRSDFAGLARALGVRGTTATNEAELRWAVRSALEVNETTVIDVIVDGTECGELNRLIRGAP